MLYDESDMIVPRVEIKSDTENVVETHERVISDESVAEAREGGRQSIWNFFSAAAQRIDRFILRAGGADPMPMDSGPKPSEIIDESHNGEEKILAVIGVKETRVDQVKGGCLALENQFKIRAKRESSNLVDKVAKLKSGAADKMDALRRKGELLGADNVGNTAEMTIQEIIVPEPFDESGIDEVDSVDSLGRAEAAMRFMAEQSDAAREEAEKVVAEPSKVQELLAVKKRLEIESRNSYED